MRGGSSTHDHQSESSMIKKFSLKNAVAITYAVSSFALTANAREQTPWQKNESTSVASADDESSTKTDDANLAKDLQNPVAGLITVPMESRVDVGPGSTWRYTLNLQPVIPFELSHDWLMVSRTILPFVCAPKPVGGEPSFDNVSDSAVVKRGPTLGGIGDLTQSFFLVPKESPGGWIWGAGPVFRMPTASREFFGQGQWGAGPTAVVLRQDGPWTCGMLANHVWSFAGWGPQDVSTTFLQPFLAYTTESNTSFGLGSEAGYDWENGQWVVPVDLSVSQLVRIGKLPLSLGLGGRLYAERPNGGPTWGVSLTVTFMFPQ